MWLLHETASNKSALNQICAVHLDGDICLDALERALGHVVARHESLRTSFLFAGERPVQRIGAAERVPIQRVDLSNIPSEDDKQCRLQETISRQLGEAFDLASGPPCRFSVIRLTSNATLVALVAHHILVDGLSAEVFRTDLARAYEATVSGEDPTWERLPIQVADYARWERDYRARDSQAAEVAYWERVLAGVPPPTSPPADHPRPANDRMLGAHQWLALPAKLTERLKDTARQAHCTLFMVLLATWQTLLHRYTQAYDICVGTAAAGRGYPELSHLIGCFINTLVLRSDLSGDPSFEGLLARVRQVALDAYAHQEVPFQKVIEGTHSHREIAKSPLFSTLLVLKNAPGADQEAAGVRFSHRRLVSEVALVDITLELWDEPGGLKGFFVYDADLFKGSTIERMAGHFATLLAGVVADPTKPISRLPILSDTERRQLVYDWNDTATEFEEEACIHELFEARVAEAPDAIAVIYGDVELTYRALNARANQLAHTLRAMGVGPDRLVGLCLDRRPSMIVGLLGVLKAGGAYVPIDPGYPPDRLAFMIADSGAPVLLTESTLLDRLPEHEARVLCLDRDWPAIAEAPATNPPKLATAENLAYVIYTSGSTGQPKGVEITHEGLLNLVYWHQRAYEIGPTDRATQLASVGFDACVWEVWPYLAAGASVHFPDEEVRNSPVKLWPWLVTQRITITFLPTPLAEAALQQPLPEGLGLRAMLTGGDRLHSGPSAPLPFQLINHYGPTENTVVSTCGLVEVASPGHPPPPIGRPIDNVQVYVLDANGNLVPPGVVGELFLGGSSLARGYLNQAGLTAQKFVPNPFSDEPGSRLYASGDLVRYLPDGDLQFIGRNDNQIKIRGFRIELGEIEAVLRRQPAVDEAVVVVRGTGVARELVAYVVWAPGQAAEWERLREYLRARVPGYMVPGAFVALEQLPLTANGKIDRAALPAPAGERQVGVAFVAPRTPTEQVLARIWGEVLRVTPVGVDDNFFDLGGDSILSIQISSRVTQAGLRVTPKELFEHQTIAKLARVAGTSEAEGAEQGLVSGPVPLTPIQYWFVEQDVAAPHHFNQAVLLEWREPIEPAWLEAVVAQWLGHHDALRTRFERTEGGWRQAVMAPDGAMPVVRVDLSAVPAAERHAALETKATELQASLDLEQGPLLRVALFELGEDRPARLLVVIHHLVVDGVSWRVLLEDLQTLCAQRRAGQPLQLPPKTTSVQQWARRLDEYAASSAVQAEAAYWRTQLGAETTPLPVDHPADPAANTAAAARRVSVTLTATETARLLHEVPQAYQTRINDVLLTALAAAFREWLGPTALVIDLEGHGRPDDLFDDLDVSRTVGWFTAL